MEDHESIKLFFKEVTQEMLYNVAYREESSDTDLNITCLSREFSKRVGDRYEPMDFFGLPGITNKDLSQFVKESQGLLVSEGNFIVSIDYKKIHKVHKQYNCRRLNDTEDSMYIADYREMLLIAACNVMIKDDGHVDVNATDRNGNTPVHFIAALPGVDSRNASNLITYLLDAGADPTIENKDGMNVLHIIAGRIEAEKDENGDVIFGKRRIDAVSWECSHRQEVINDLSQHRSQRLSRINLYYLTNRAGRDGNTVMHEWAMSTAVIEKNLEQEVKIASKLSQLGGNLNTMNKLGLLPIHFAFHLMVLDFLVSKGAVCHVRSYQDETPLLFILKYYVALPLAFWFSSLNLHFKTTAKDILDLCHTDPAQLKRNVCNPIFVVAQLKQVIERREIKEMAWLTDQQGFSPLEVVLTCIRVASYRIRIQVFWPRHMENLKNIQNMLFEIFHQIVATATNQNCLKQHNNKRQSLLHVLIDVGLNADVVCSIDSTSTQTIVKCLEYLLEHGIQVNAVDAKGQTALHLCCLYYQRCPNLFGQCAQILLNHNALTDLKDNSGKSVQNILANNNELKSVCVQTKRKVHCQSECHRSQVIQLVASTNVNVVEKYRYSSESPIGSGAFSCVYVAIKDENEDKSSKLITCSTYALKRLEKARIDPKEIKREIDLLISISRNCENIVDYNETIDKEPFYYIVLELMDGDLRRFVTDKDMKAAVAKDPAIMVHAAHDIINGLVFLHNNKFLHRDLKPGNILYAVDPSLRFKISDFGLAKNISSSCTVTTTKGTGAMAPGTRCWMAPELVSLQSREHTMESDVFALGLVLHYLLTLGKHAFIAETEEQPTHVIEKRIVDMNLAIDESLSSEAKYFIRLILAESPARRPPAVRLPQDPFFWSYQKKNKFLIAVGDQVEAVNPSKHPKSALENCLQITDVGIEVGRKSWDTRIPELYREMTTAWKRKKYRNNILIDLVRFIRNAYHHKEEHCAAFKTKLENNIFLQEFPSLFFDVYLVLLNKGFLSDSNRANIREVMENEI